MESTLTSPSDTTASPGPPSTQTPAPPTGSTTRTSRTSLETFSPIEIAAAIAIDTNGLPAFPPRPIHINTTAIKIVGGCAFLMCPRCKKRLPFGHFDYRDIPYMRHPTCYPCKEARRIATKQPRRPTTVIPRRICMSNKGVLHLYCTPCGRYFPSYKCQASRLWTRRSICPSCQEGEDRAKSREFTTSRKHAFVYTYLQQCTKCHFYSKTPVCGACKRGSAPLAGSSFLCNADDIRATQHNNMASLVFVILGRADINRTKKTVASTIAGAKIARYKAARTRTLAAERIARHNQERAITFSIRPPHRQHRR